ncbi:MAG TPA: 50S ribosomal protein L32 [Saprospiraceae bacterium]|jgi:large subunit ribosomal protein L32|nr:50S ribosomal protein L32 [Saprospiraceae bacterium]
MAHPKSRTSKQRKRKRRTHYKASLNQLATCPTTGEVHQYHRSYWLDGKMYYRGKVVIDQIEEDLD